MSERSFLYRTVTWWFRKPSPFVQFLRDRVRDCRCLYVEGHFIVSGGHATLIRYGYHTPWRGWQLPRRLDKAEGFLKGLPKHLGWEQVVVAIIWNPRSFIVSALELNDAKEYTFIETGEEEEGIPALRQFTG